MSKHEAQQGLKLYFLDDDHRWWHLISVGGAFVYRAPLVYPRFFSVAFGHQERVKMDENIHEHIQF
jgi:hypothetical protein